MTIQVYNGNLINRAQPPRQYTIIKSPVESLNLHEGPLVAIVGEYCHNVLASHHRDRGETILA